MRFLGLIVEDELLHAVPLRSTLASLGLQVLGTAKSFDEAVAKTNELEPDLIVMDIHIEGERNGVEAAESNRNFSHSPFVFQSSSTEVEWIEKARRMPDSLYMSKSTSRSDWNSTLEIFRIRNSGMVAQGFLTQTPPGTTSTLSSFPKTTGSPSMCPFKTWDD
jgi:DNA-binding NarL/FixJ family response regulator